MIGTLTYAGAEKYVIDLINNFEKYKYPVKSFLILLQTPKNDLLNSLYIQKDNILQLNIKSMKHIETYKEARKIIEFIKKNNIDIIHSHMDKADLIGSYIGKRYKNKITISTEHNINQFRVKISKEDIFCRFYDFIRLKNTDGIVFISKAVQNFFLEHTRFPSQKTTIIYHGVDSDFLQKQISALSFNIDKNKINLAVIGRLTEQKGHSFLLEVIKNVKEKENLLHFYIAGEGELKKYLMTMTKKYCIQNIVTFLGVVDYVPVLLNSVDALVVPSRWEGFGIVAIEAMAMKKAVIASKIDGLAEIVINNKTGYLIEKDDILKWEQILISLDKKTLNLFGENGFERQQELFCINKTIDQTYKFYTKIIQNTKYFETKS